MGPSGMRGCRNGEYKVYEFKKVSEGKEAKEWTLEDIPAVKRYSSMLFQAFGRTRVRTLA